VSASCAPAPHGVLFQHGALFSAFSVFAEHRLSVAGAQALTTPACDRPTWSMLKLEMVEIAAASRAA
jgi:ABC-type transporter Mla maintaining outer membrane lipid asymmetry ATPase subunit MlaF